MMGIRFPVMPWAGSCVPLQECNQWLVVELKHIYPFFLQLLLILLLLTELPGPRGHGEIHFPMNHGAEPELCSKDFPVLPWAQQVKVDQFFSCQNSGILCCRSPGMPCLAYVRICVLECFKAPGNPVSWSKDKGRPMDILKEDPGSTATALTPCSSFTEDLFPVLSIPLLTSWKVSFVMTAPWNVFFSYPRIPASRKLKFGHSARTSHQSSSCTIPSSGIKKNPALLHWKNDINRAWMICGCTESGKAELRQVELSAQGTEKHGHAFSCPFCWKSRWHLTTESGWDF